MVFGEDLMELLKLYKGNNLFMHDDLALKVCLAVGGIVYKDSNAYLRYRQHGNNVIGTREKLSHSIKRRFSSFIHQSCERSRELRDIYANYKDYIPEENLKILEKIAFYKGKKFGKISVIADKRIKACDRKTTRHFRLGILLGFF